MLHPRTGLSIALIALAMAGAFVWATRSRQGASDSGERTDSSTGAVSDAGRPPSAIEGSPDSTTLVAAPKTPETPASSETVVDERPGRMRPHRFSIDGTIRFRDGKNEFERCSFRLVAPLLLREPIAVDAIDGRFTVDVPFAWTYAVADVRIDGGEPLRGRTRVVISEGKTAEIVLDRPRHVVLQAIDAVTKRPVPSMRAVGEADEFGSGTDREVVGDGTGLIHLPEGTGTETWRLVGEGYAWRSVVVSFEHEATIPIEMLPGGSIRVVVRQFQELKGASVALWRQGRRLESLPQPEADGTTFAEGVPPGPCAVRVMRGAFGEPGDDYGSATVEIVAGRTTETTIDARSSDARELVVVDGTITIASEWPLAPRVAASPENLIRMRRIAAGGSWSPDVAVTETQASLASRRAFQSSPIAPGAYLVYIPSMQWGAEVVVSPGGAHLAFVIPPPTPLRVRIVDDEAGKSFLDASLSWNAIRPDDPAGTPAAFGMAEALRGRGSESYLILAPAGPIELTAFAPGHAPESRRIEVPPKGPFDVQLRLPRGASVLIRLLVDGQPSTLDDVDVFGVGARCFTSGKSRNGTVTLQGFRPGTVATGVVGELAGFVVPKATQVEVTSGEAKEVSIDLVRVR